MTTVLARNHAQAACKEIADHGHGYEETDSYQNRTRGPVPVSRLSATEPPSQCDRAPKRGAPKARPASATMIKVLRRTRSVTVDVIKVGWFISAFLIGSDAGDPSVLGRQLLLPRTIRCLSAC
jgi:hypothetical protein